MSTEHDPERPPSSISEPEGQPDSDASEGTDEQPQSLEQTDAPPRRRTRLVAVAAAAALVLAGGGVAVASAHKTVEIQVDGSSRTVSTFSGSVSGLLEEEGLVVGDHDLLVPGPQEQLTEASTVVLRTAQQVDVLVDGEQVTLWTVGATAGEALAGLSDRGGDVSLVASRSEDRVALELPVVAGGPVDVVADGETRRLEIDGVADLAAVLLRAEITLAPSDRVAVTAAADGTPVVTVTRVASQEQTRTETIELEVVERGTDELYVGQSRVVDEGTDGTRTFWLRERVVDGEVVSTKLVRTEVTAAPQDRVIEVGTAERPVAPPPPAPVAPSEAPAQDAPAQQEAPAQEEAPEEPADGGGAVGGDVWAALAQCESGGNPQAVSPNGLYYGLYQFSIGTWQSVGGSGLPTQASASEQTQRAQALQARSGWGQWPHCSSQLGLR